MPRVDRSDLGYLASGALLAWVFMTGEGGQGEDSLLAPMPVEIGLGVTAVLTLVLCRRRWPVWTAAAVVAMGMVASSAFGVIFPTVFRVALSRSWRVVTAVTAAHVIPVVALWPLGAVSAADYRASLITVGLLDAVMITSGLLVRSQRARAQQAAESDRLRIEEARRQERERIAREMHDVLAHRISLLTMHAGALEFRPDATREEITRAAGLIRRSGYEALEDLRELIGMLRSEPVVAGDAERPQPTLAVLPELVADTRRAGTPVELDLVLSDLDEVPTAVGRHAYRVVQEALTNARKHAPGERVRVEVDGKPGATLRIEVANRLPDSAGHPAIPGAGVGLVGLRERAELAGGTLEHELTGTEFRLRATLPWPEPVEGRT